MVTVIVFVFISNCWVYYIVLLLFFRFVKIKVLGMPVHTTQRSYERHFILKCIWITAFKEVNENAQIIFSAKIQAFIFKKVNKPVWVYNNSNELWIMFLTTESRQPIQLIINAKDLRQSTYSWYTRKNNIN